MTDSPSSDQIVADGPPKVGCNCITLTNDALKRHNCQLDLAFEIDRATGVMQATVACHTVLLERRRGAKAISIVASYCPFCGTRYGAALAAATAPQVEPTP